MRRINQISRQIGRRGCALLFFSLLDLVYATSLAADPPTANGTGHFLASMLPLPVWAILWGSVGILCAVQAFMRSDRAAFAAASLIKVVWGIIALIGWLIGEVDRGYVSAVIWLALAAFVHVIAGWPEPRQGR